VNKLVHFLFEHSVVCLICEPWGAQGVLLAITVFHLDCPFAVHHTRTRGLAME